ncbi:glycosyltransferase [Kaistia algarum]|uniref:glycosyltransferase n=1 Tax=Kaistia algarum TaxID=2083279 RepID=UPI001401EB7D|nr:glycosyltransferase [Kaistia algarum]MCX5513187.1 glycosyltransferase [Kaistia algarum]
MAKRKYLFYTRSFSGGGAEPVWALLASLFAERGDEVVLALDERGEPAVPPSERLRVEIVGTGAVEGVRGVARLLREIQPDAALSAIAANALKLAAANRLARTATPLVFSVHGLLEHKTGKLSAAALYGLPLLSRSASRIVCVSDGLKRTMIKDWHADPAKTERIYNPVPSQTPVASRAALDARPPHVVALGRLSPDKGFDVLIDAFAKVKTEGATLSIAGKGVDRDALQARIKARGLSDRVRLVGFVVPASLYAVARLCVIPSRSEAFGLVAAEALSAGLPLVATDCDGPREILDAGRYGRIVPVGDVDAMAAAIDAALGDPGDPAPRIERAKTFSVEAGFKAWLELLDEIATERASG